VLTHLLVASIHLFLSPQIQNAHELGKHLMSEDMINYSSCRFELQTIVVNISLISSVLPFLYPSHPVVAQREVLQLTTTKQDLHGGSKTRGALTCLASALGLTYKRLHEAHVEHVPKCLGSGDVLSNATLTQDFVKGPQRSWVPDCISPDRFIPHLHYRLVLDTVGTSI
jgi:hypothetical protein